MRGTQRITENGHLEIGGVNTASLVDEFTTPLFVYDVALIRKNIHAFQEAFYAHKSVKSRIVYASKAFSVLAMLQLAMEEGLSVDVVSGGEMYAALKAGLNPEDIVFHGSNKAREELKLAVQAGVGTIVIDNLHDVHQLIDLTDELKENVKVLLRLTPGVEAHTHDYIMTGQEDSKFGFNLKSEDLSVALQLINQSQRIHYKGVHCHIGSQIFETEGFELAIGRLFQFIEQLTKQYKWNTSVVNTGGGFGIKYVDGDEPQPIRNYINAIVEKIIEESEARSLSVPEIWVEPGRGIVGEAGTTLYSVGALKKIPDIRHYLSVDGGMADNIRPALYQAKYDAVLANRMNDACIEKFTVAGKCCESGDILIDQIELPSPKIGDTLAVFSTGAYGYSMASHYNRLPKPAVVFVENGEAQLVAKRESYEDLLKNEFLLNRCAFTAV